MLSVLDPIVEDLKHVSNSSNHGWLFFAHNQPLDLTFKVTHRNLPCHFHPNPPETHVSLGGGILSTFVSKIACYEPCNVTSFFMDLAIILTHTDLQTNLRATMYDIMYIYIYPGACSFYTTHNFLHLLGHPLQQILLMEEMRLTNSYPVRYMYGIFTFA